jgi:hypothetical protein
MELSALGKMLLLVGIALALVGAALMLAPRIPWLGRLPGDLRIQGERSTFYIPLATCILLSAVLSAVLYVVSRLRR